MSYVRQTDACCHPGGTQRAPAGLVKLGGSGGSDSGNCGGGREVQSGEGGHTQNLKNNNNRGGGRRMKLGLRQATQGTITMQKPQMLTHKNVKEGQHFDHTQRGHENN